MEHVYVLTLICLEKFPDIQVPIILGSEEVCKYTWKASSTFVKRRSKPDTTFGGGSSATRRRTSPQTTHVSARPGEERAQRQQKK
jgi:hypothetical protein